MCAATAAAIGTAVATVAAGAISATQASGGDSGGGVPQQTALKGFPPASGMQNYVARMLALNADTRPPTFDEWVTGGGKDTYQSRWETPGFTPTEARQLRMVDMFGDPIPTYDPATQGETGLTLEQRAWLGKQRRGQKKREPHGEGFATFPEERLSMMYDRQKRLRQLQAEQGLNPKQEKKLGKVTRNIERWQRNPTAYASGPVEKEDEGMGFMDFLSGKAITKPPWEWKG